MKTYIKSKSKQKHKEKFITTIRQNFTQSLVSSSALFNFFLFFFFFFQKKRYEESVVLLKWLCFQIKIKLTIGIVCF